MADATAKRTSLVGATTPVLVFIIALLAPWDPRSYYGGAGFPIACVITASGALYVGARSPAWSALKRGAAVGGLSLIAFICASYIAIESGWYGRDWGTESDVGAVELVLGIVFYGIPAAAIGAAVAVLARAGRVFVQQVAPR